jgi:uncharacterized RmlC-like cupin family protein
VGYEVIRAIRAEELVSEAVQTQNLHRKTGAESSQLWMGLVACDPGKESGGHHHGKAETASYILSGHMRIYYGEQFEEYVDIGPGDFVYVPPFVPHIERNLSDYEPLILITGCTPRYIVINLADDQAGQHTMNNINHSQIEVVRSSDLDPNTNQPENLPMRKGVEVPHLWMGRATSAPGQNSGLHSHGEAETGVYVLSGRARISYGNRFKEYVELGPGDFMYVPTFIPHVENNLSDCEPVEFVVVRIPRNIVVNLDGKVD